MASSFFIGQHAQLASDNNYCMHQLVKLRKGANAPCMSHMIAVPDRPLMVRLQYFTFTRHAKPGGPLKFPLDLHCLNLDLNES